MRHFILVVDDERDLTDLLEHEFRKDGHLTRSAASGKAALDIALGEPTPDLVVLDLMLPDMSGTQVCRLLRREERTRDVPIVMLTARDDEIDRVVAFELGVDDYVTKPFSVRELCLRVRAMLRRTRRDDARGTTGDEQVRFGCLTVDHAGHHVFVNDTEVSLTPLEFRLVTTMLSRRGRVQSRETLLADVWGLSGDIATRTVDTHVKRLREKLGAAGEYVQTVRGVGYRFAAVPDERK